MTVDKLLTEELQLSSGVSDAMTLQNLEENIVDRSIVDRIQRALAEELKRLRGKPRLTGNGQATRHILARRAEAMAKDSAMKEMSGDATHDTDVV